ncbi:MAG: proteobacterial dedicated sortase system response regulator [Gammaproteobacteria bacterium]|nr:MAG: proteobacterial dedicated sortase system response regulator [Gammaproteobacteria bacterium]
MTKRIAIVEDEPAIRDNYRDHLTKQGYQVEAYTGRLDALRAFRKALPDLAILDIGLGDEAEGGFELCRELRAISDSLPIIFLTARDDDIDAISGLRLGADDYLTKDISLQNLSARIAALFRRIDILKFPDQQKNILQRDRLKIDLDQMRASYDDEMLDLTLTEFWIIHALARYPGHVKNREQLMREANIVVDDSTITSHIKRMRRKFQEIDPEFDAVETVYGMGYRWNNPG